MSLSEQIFYGIWLIGLLTLFTIFVMQVQRNLRLARLERQRRFWTEILNELLQLPDSSTKVSLLRLWAKVEFDSHQFQSPRSFIVATTDVFKEAAPLLETLASEHQPFLQEIIPKLLGIYYTGNFWLRFAIAALSIVVLAWLVVKLLQLPFFWLFRESAEMIHRLRGLQLEIAKSS